MPNYFYAVLGMILCFFGVWLGSIDKTAIATFVLLAGVAFIAFTKFDKLVEMRLGSLIVKAEQTIGEAEAIIQKLQKLALTLSEFSIYTLECSQFFFGPGQKSKAEALQTLLNFLKQLGISDTNRGLFVEKNWYKYREYEFQQEILRQCKNQEIQEKYSSSETFCIFPYDTFKEDIERSSPESPEIQKLFEQYEYARKNKQGKFL